MKKKDDEKIFRLGLSFFEKMHSKFKNENDAVILGDYAQIMCQLYFKKLQPLAIDQEFKLAPGDLDKARLKAFLEELSVAYQADAKLAEQATFMSARAHLLSLGKPGKTPFCTDPEILTAIQEQCAIRHLISQLSGRKIEQEMIQLVDHCFSNYFIAFKLSPSRALSDLESTFANHPHTMALIYITQEKNLSSATTINGLSTLYRRCNTQKGAEFTATKATIVDWLTKNGQRTLRDKDGDEIPIAYNFFSQLALALAQDYYRTLDLFPTPLSEQDTVCVNRHKEVEAIQMKIIDFQLLVYGAKNQAQTERREQRVLVLKAMKEGLLLEQVPTLLQLKRQYPKAFESSKRWRNNEARPKILYKGNNPLEDYVIERLSQWPKLGLAPANGHSSSGSALASLSVSSSGVAATFTSSSASSSSMSASSSSS